MNASEIKLRKQEIAGLSKTATGEALTALAREMNELIEKETELKQMEARNAIAAQLQQNATSAHSIDTKQEDHHMNFETVEYRNAFMKYVLTGEMPAEYRSVSTTADNAAVIPIPVMNTVIEKMEQCGNILPLVRKLSYAPGVVVPTSALATEATWLQEGAAIEEGAKTTVGVTFGAFELGASIGVSFKAHIQSLAAFEAAVAENVSRAMVKALEKAIIAGDGNAKPKGIITETVDAKQKVALAKALSYQDIVNIVKAIPSAYKAGSVITMNENTFLDILGITDKQGQPIARVNYGVDGAPQASLLGRRVIFTDFLKDLGSAANGEVVAFAFNYAHYALNTAYEMDLVTYTDDKTRNKVYQSVGLYDGKVIDKNGLVLISATK